MNYDPKIKEHAISVEKMRQSDAYTIKNFVFGKELMHRAAMGIYNACDWSGKKILIVTGSGNNGGDGYALAVILANNGFKPDICRLSDKFSSDGEFYFKEAKKCGVPDFVFDNKHDFKKYDVIVDCILGTGFSGTAGGVVGDAICAINHSGAFIICADINSGLNGDTGMGFPAVKSNLTVSIGYCKKGMFINDAPKLTEKLINVDIGIVLV